MANDYPQEEGSLTDYREIIIREIIKGGVRKVSLKDPYATLGDVIKRRSAENIEGVERGMKKSLEDTFTVLRGLEVASLKPEKKWIFIDKSYYEIDLERTIELYGSSEKEQNP